MKLQEITIPIRTIVLLALMLAPIAVSAQRSVRTDIELRFVNPTGFIAPGASAQLYLQLVNPPDSGVTINNVSGGGYGTSFSPNPGFTTSRDVIRESPLCETVSYCPVSGSFPLQPGESMTLAHREIHAIQGLALNTEIGVRRIDLSVQIDSEYATVYSSNQALYILTEDGTGDASIFDDRKIDLSPVVFPELHVELDAPPQIPAGEHFNLRAKITNVVNPEIFRIENQFGIYPAIDVNGKFSFTGCTNSCSLTGHSFLEQGKLVTLDLGNYYYVDDVLEDSELTLTSWPFLVFDSEERRLPMTIAVDPVSIEIVGPPGSPIPNPALVIPSREALQIQDLTSGDERLLHDPNTGNDWLRLTASDNVNYEEVQSQLATNPALAGFRLARRSQVEALLLNYLHHRNVQAAAFDLYATSKSINDALYDFVELIGNTASPFPDSINTTLITGGLIADKPPLSASAKYSFSIMHLVANPPSSVFFSSPRGLRTIYSTTSTQLAFEGSYWLVRARNELSWIPLGATYALDELRLTTLQVDDEYFRVSMNFRNAQSDVLQLTGLQPLESPPTAPVAQFYPQSGELLIPELSVCQPDGSRDRYSVRLTLIPDSDPALFVLRESELLASVHPGTPVLQGICQ